MTEVSVRDARNNLSQLIKQAQQGHEVIIASRGKPVARIVPIRQALTGPELAAWFRVNQAPPSEARTQAEVETYLATERDSWE